MNHTAPVPKPLALLALLLAGCADPAADPAPGADADADAGRQQVGVWHGDVGPADLPTLCTKYRELTVDGDIDLRDVVKDLTPLGCVVEVTGSVTLLDNDGLSSLVGLHHLKHAGSVTLMGNHALKDLTGLGALEETYQLMVMADGVARLDGLTALASVEILVIAENPALVSLATGGPLKAVGTASISDNPLLQDLVGLNVEALDFLTVDRNASLKDLHGLEALTHIDGSVAVSGNASLASLAGLEHLVDVAAAQGGLTNELTLDANPSLVDVTALEGLSEVTDAVYIRDNVELTDAAAQALVDTFERVGEVTISGNG
ncbi:MAG: hypothetical protein R3F59_06420 [Myxococcota bacterium]